MARVWTKERRENLEFYISKGFIVPRIAEMMGISPQTIYNELKRTLTEEEYKGRRFVMYTAAKAIERDILRITNGGE